MHYVIRKFVDATVNEISAVCAGAQRQRLDGRLGFCPLGRGDRPNLGRHAARPLATPPHQARMVSHRRTCRAGAGRHRHAAEGAALAENPIAATLTGEATPPVTRVTSSRACHRYLRSQPGVAR